jgi:predicted RNA-binding protein
VIYECLKDAVQAFDIFYNRQFDGRLMKCDMAKNVGSNPAGPIILPE